METGEEAVVAGEEAVVGTMRSEQPASSIDKASGRKSLLQGMVSDEKRRVKKKGEKKKGHTTSKPAARPSQAVT